MDQRRLSVLWPGFRRGGRRRRRLCRRASCKSARDRIVTAEEVIRNEPDIIIGSWCGKKFRPEKLAKRPGFDRIPAVKRGALHEIKSPLILQPGPAALTGGLAALRAIIADASTSAVAQSERALRQAAKGGDAR